jgi:hypothetical protein
MARVETLGFSSVENSMIQELAHPHPSTPLFLDECAIPFSIFSCCRGPQAITTAHRLAPFFFLSKWTILMY